MILAQCLTVAIVKRLLPVCPRDWPAMQAGLPGSASASSRAQGPSRFRALVLGMLACLAISDEPRTRAQSSAAAPAPDPARRRAGLEQQYRRSPDPELLAQLALAYEQEGRQLQASDLAQRYVAQLRQPPPEALGRSLAPLLSRTLPAHCEMGVFADQPSLGAVVLLDDQPVGTTDIRQPRLRVTPGSHTVRLEHHGQQGQKLPVDCPLRRRVDVTMSLANQGTQTTAIWDLLVLHDEQLASEHREGFRRALSRQLEDVNVLVISFDQPLLAAAAKPRVDLSSSEASCPELACLAPTLDALGAQWALHIQRAAASVGPTTMATGDGPSALAWYLNLRDHRVRQGFYQDQSPPQSGPPMTLAADLAERSLKLLHGPWRRSVVSLRIASEPSPAALYINEQAVGSTPVSVSLYRQDFAVVARRPGYLDVSQTWSKDELAGVLRATLTLPRDAVVARRRAIKRSVGWTSLALGGVGIALGAALWAIDGREFGCDENGAFCQRRYTTQSLGIASLALGGALLGVGGLSLGLAAREPQ